MVYSLKVAKEKLEKLSMVWGVGELYNAHATSIYEHLQHDKHTAEWTCPSKAAPFFKNAVFRIFTWRYKTLPI